MDINTKNGTLDDHIKECLKDSPDIVRRISLENPAKGSTVELVTELPAVRDVDIIIGMVLRWKEIAKLFECKIRVYAWSHTEEIEKYVLQCVQNSPELFVTVIPATLRKGYL